MLKLLLRMPVYVGIYAVWGLWLSWWTGAFNGFKPWLNDWFRWDAEWYYRLSKTAYGADAAAMAFPPGYSWLIGGLANATSKPFVFVALIVNLIAFGFAGVVAAECFRKQWRVPWLMSFLFYLASPVAYFVFSPYPDVLFLAIFWPALFLALQDPKTLSLPGKLLAAVLVFCSPWVRFAGFALGVWIFFRRWFVATLVLALSLVLFMNYRAQGDAFHFVKAQENFSMAEGWSIFGFRFHWHELFLMPRPWLVQDFASWFLATPLPWISTFLLFVSLIWFAKRKEWIVVATILAMMVFSRHQTYWRSLLRLDLPLMPLMAVPWLSYWSGPGKILKRYGALFVYGALLLSGFVLQAIFASTMHNGGWTF